MSGYRYPTADVGVSNMRRLWLSFALTPLLLLGSAAGLGGAVLSQESGESNEPRPIRTLPSDGISPDDRLVAEGRGWTVDEAVAQHRVSDAIGKIATIVYKERPDVFVGSAVSETPGATPTLYVKGPADKFVRDVIAASGTEAVLADNQPFSRAENQERKLKVHHALEAAGFQNVATGVDITRGGLIRAAVAAEPGAPATVQEVLSAVPSDVRSQVEVTIGSPDGFRDTNSSFGGMMVTKGGGNYATSGWSVGKVIGGSFVTGVTTAGHASGADGIVHPGFGTHTFVFQSEHRGTWGDIEWHTTNQAEPPQFYADQFNNIRSVLFIEAVGGISVGETVCQYGRFSNSRDCGLTVFDASIACTLSGVFNDNLAQMSAITSIAGDSGGGWSFDFTAYGSQKGWCSNKDAWSVVDLFDEAIGVIPLVDDPE